MTNPYHYRYVDIADKVGRDLKFFCAVRNPWSRTASRYLFSKPYAEKWAPNDRRADYIRHATFADYIRDRRVFDIPEHPGMPWMGPMTSWFNQLEWIRDEEGRIMCDCLRLEHIESDLSEYFAKRIVVVRRNETARSVDYRTMYDDSLAALVEEIFREDIEYFGFTFDSPATKNIAVGLQDPAPIT